MKSKKVGGSRKGAGRKSQGKKPYSVTLTRNNVTWAQANTKNLSGLLDDLLKKWIADRLNTSS